MFDRIIEFFTNMDNPYFVLYMVPVLFALFYLFTSIFGERGE